MSKTPQSKSSKAILDFPEPKSEKIKEKSKPFATITSQTSSALYRAVYSHNFSLCKQLLNQGSDPNETNLYGETSLHYASDSSQYEIAELLLSFNANPNCHQNNGETPLHISAFKGDLRMVNLLLKYGASPNIQNKQVCGT